MKYIIDKELLIKWLKKCKDEGYELYGIKKDSGNQRFESLEPEEVSFDYENAYIPPKDIIFPQTEKLLDVDPSKKEIHATIPEVKRKIIFGIRPCDARGVGILDTVFGTGYKDPYYSSRRRDNILVVLGCNEYCEDGFCNAVGGGPKDSFGADIMVEKLDANNKFSIEFKTDAGKKIEFDEFLGINISEVDSEKDRKESIREEEGSSEIKPEYEKNLQNADRWLKESFTNKNWGKFANKCIGCGICTYLCPTCHCFDISDVNNSRIRTWDSCQFSEYTVHTSSHNPRPEKMHRVRNRVLHKFLYFKQRNGEVMCVGCGRCVRLCPEKIDIREIVESMEG